MPKPIRFSGPWRIAHSMKTSIAHVSRRVQRRRAAAALAGREVVPLRAHPRALNAGVEAFAKSAIARLSS